ncbi:hypothetical protein RCL_jg14870.t1 [Rhizophagus clarus]|uniref:Uncharacterized protein n=1 Tax=Rhizophagus clarus TaxID=94130 RepID=A0A8H3QYN7_9GLOM|nr:hypothetical protein RCL_jg14870.t1 [Rhizophagus clarus]
MNLPQFKKIIENTDVGTNEIGLVLDIDSLEERKTGVNSTRNTWSSPHEKEIKVSALPENSSGEKLPDVNMSTVSNDSTSVKSQVYHPHLPLVKLVNLTNPDFRFLFLPGDPEEK